MGRNLFVRKDLRNRLAHCCAQLATESGSRPAVNRQKSSSPKSLRHDFGSPVKSAPLNTPASFQIPSLPTPDSELPTHSGTTATNSWQTASNWVAVMILRSSAKPISSVRSQRRLIRRAMPWVSAWSVG